MDYYGTMRHDYIQKQMYPNDHRVDFFPPKGGIAGSNVKIVPKAECVPKFVTKIEGNALEEGERVFFEGIVDSQPHPVFSWYFNEEPVVPGQPGWEDAEIHESRKMSTLIIKYVREYHMGKYTLVAENHLGHAVSNCDLIVRKKQFPPVFWQRLYNYEAEAGSRLVAEVEVGGWPVPTVTWFKDDEVLTTKTHTENWNGYPNKYVPDARIEVIRLDQIRHCVIFHRIGESDAGVYSVQAVNPLGEAVCEAEFVIVPGEGGAGDLYIPEKWKNGNRLDWVTEDRRAKRYENVTDSPMSDEERAAMFKRFDKPLPRALEYLASLPDYYPKPFDKLPQVPYKCDPSDVRKGKTGGKPTRPSRFQPGKINHNGYICDDGGRILPWWPNPTDPNARDPNKMNYRSVRPNLQEPRPQPPYEEGPPCPHVWESHETIEQLYKILDKVGCKLEINDIRSDKMGNKDQKRRQQSDGRSYMQQQAEARKQVSTSTKSSQVKKFSYLSNQQDNQAASAASTSTPWKAALDKNVPGAQSNAEDFTQQFMKEMYGGSNSTSASQQMQAQSVEQVESSATEEKQCSESVDEHYEEMMQYVEQHERHVEAHRVYTEVENPPALPPKTKIMFSPSRHLFSPSESVDDSDTTSVNTVEYVPVKEKVKMIAQQQEEIVRREELRKKTGGDVPTGGVRILPPSPVTVRKEHSSEQHHRVHFQQDEVDFRQQQQSKQLSKQQTSQLTKQSQQNQLTKQSQQYQLTQHEQSQQNQLMQQQMQQSQLLQQQQIQQQQQLLQQQQQQLTQARQQAQQLTNLEKSDSRSSQLSVDETTMYEATAHVTSSSNTAQIVTATEASNRIIPRLEDKYEISAGLDELVAQETHSEAASYTSSVQQASISSRATQQSAYSSMTASSSSTTMQQEKHISSETSSIKTLKDSSYSTASSVASSAYMMQSSEHQASLQRSGNNTENLASSSVTESATPSWVRQQIRESSDNSPAFGSPMTRRKINQSPLQAPESEPKYRTPPQTPFQPGFYKAPALEEVATNPFPLSPKVARSTKITKEKSSESIASSTSSRKMRRKKREAQRMVADNASDSEENMDDVEL